MDRRGPRPRGGRHPRMDRGDRDFEEDFEDDSEQDSDYGGMGPDRRSTRDGPPGRRGAGPYDMNDDMDMPPRGGRAGGRGRDDYFIDDDMDIPPHGGHAGGRGHDDYLMDDDMDMPPRGGHRRAPMDPEADYRMQLQILNHTMSESRRRRAGGRPPQEFSPPIHFMEPDPRQSRAGGSGLRGPRGEPLFEYVDAEEYESRQQHHGGNGSRGMGGPSRRRDPYDDSGSDEEPEHQPSSSRRGYRASAAGRGGRSRR